MLPLHFGKLLGQSAIALLFVGISVTVAVSTALASRLRPARVLGASAPIAAAGIALAGATEGVALWVVALALAGAGLGACNTGSTGVLLETVGVDRIVLPMIVWSQLGIVGYLIGPAVGGAVVEAAGFTAIGVIPLAGAAAVLAALAWTRRRRAVPSATTPPA